MTVEPGNCPACGYRVPPSVACCPSCGRQLEGVSDGSEVADEAPTLPAWAEGVRPDALPAWATPGAPNTDPTPPTAPPPTVPPPTAPGWPPPPGPEGPPGASPPRAWPPGASPPGAWPPPQTAPPPTAPGWPPPPGPQGPQGPLGAWPPPAGWAPQPQWGSTAWPQPDPYAAQRGPRTDGVAIAALIVGGVSLLLFFLFVPAVAAIILGLVGIVRVQRGAGLRKGRGLAVTGSVLGVLSLIAGVVAIVGLNRTGVFSGSLLAYSRLQIGDCFNEPGVLPLYRRVSCGSPHDREVYGRVLDPSASDASFPGAPALQSEARQGCAPELESYLGNTPNRSLYLISSITPNQASWDRGERVLVCILKSADGSRLSGSARAGLS